MIPQMNEFIKEEITYAYEDAYRMRVQIDVRIIIDVYDARVWVSVESSALYHQSVYDLVNSMRRYCISVCEEKMNEINKPK